jgi:hypothetical protein
VVLGSMSTPAMRQGYVDLGYEIKPGAKVMSLPYLYDFNAKTNV